MYGSSDTKQRGAPSGTPRSSIPRNYLLCSHFWFATVQEVLQADWQEVWHSPQPPCAAVCFRVAEVRVLIWVMIRTSRFLEYVYFLRFLCCRRRRAPKTPPTAALAMVRIALISRRESCTCSPNHAKLKIARQANTITPAARPQRGCHAEERLAARNAAHRLPSTRHRSAQSAILSSGRPAHRRPSRPA